MAVTPRIDLQQGYDDQKDAWATRWKDFLPLHERYRFTIDVAASDHNAKLPRYYTRADDGLAQSWAGERVWCNPPYSVIRPWVEKAWAEVDAELVAMIIPADRTERSWWQDLVEPQRDRPGGRLWTRFYPSRWRFVAAGEDRIRAHARPRFGICLLLWGAEPPPPPPLVLPGQLELAGA